MIRTLAALALAQGGWLAIAALAAAERPHRLNLSSANANEIANYMNSVGYRLQSYVFHTALLCLAEFDEEICHRFEPVIL